MTKTSKKEKNGAATPFSSNRLTAEELLKKYGITAIDTTALHEELAEIRDRQQKFGRSPESKAMIREFLDNLNEANREEDERLKKLGLR